MNEAAQIGDLLEQAYEGEPGRAGTAWHGPSVRRVLDGVTWTAARRRTRGAHSIWELTLHIAVWDEICRRRLEGEVIRTTTGDPGDWPPPPRATPANWAATLRRLNRAQDALVAVVRGLSARDLSRKTPGWPWTNRLMIHGTLHHDLYHAGQIALLRRRPDGTTPFAKPISTPAGVRDAR
jgi:uncharacterized damage-inducible protein DinB